MRIASRRARTRLGIPHRSTRAIDPTRQYLATITTQRRPGTITIVFGGTRHILGGTRRILSGLRPRLPRQRGHRTHIPDRFRPRTRVRPRPGPSAGTRSRQVHPNTSQPVPDLRDLTVPGTTHHVIGHHTYNPRRAIKRRPQLPGCGIQQGIPCRARQFRQLRIGPIAQPPQFPIRGTTTQRARQATLDLPHLGQSVFDGPQICCGPGSLPDHAFRALDGGCVPTVRIESRWHRRQMLFHPARQLGQLRDLRQVTEPFQPLRLR